MLHISFLNFVVKKKPMKLRTTKERKREAIGNTIMFIIAFFLLVWMLYNSFI